jgi:hypothetical protein
MAPAPPPPNSAEEAAKSPGDAACGVGNVISTSTVFAAALERLNRLSIVHLLQQIIHEVEHHCQTFDAKTTHEVNKLRLEVLAELTALGERAAQHHQQVTLLYQHLTTLEARLAEYAASDELQQIEVLLRRLLADSRLAQIVSGVRIQVGAQVFTLSRLLEVLATADKVVDTHIDYNDTDITGARLVLADQTRITFVCKRHEDPSAQQLQYIFQTADWKGLKAGFIFGFARRTTELRLCGRAVLLANYDGVYQSNIKFDLCEPPGPPPACEPSAAAGVRSPL